MIEIGRLCIKTAGRDAMQHCVVIEIIDDNYVLVDGNTRRKKVNKSHLEPLNKVLSVKKGADTKTVHEELKKAGIEIRVRGEAKKPKPQVKKAVPEKKTDKKNSKKKKE